MLYPFLTWYINAILIPARTIIRDVIRSSPLPKRELAKQILLQKNGCSCSFLYENYKSLLQKVNRIVTNIYFNNNQKKIFETLRQKAVSKSSSKNK